MGGSSSKSHKLDRVLSTTFPDNERFFGLENFGNTCYANSVLQSLYFCPLFRESCLEYCRQRGITASNRHTVFEDDDDDDLLVCLCELFLNISTQKKRCGVHAPRKFIHKLRMENELFRSYMHQDAHEFLNFLLNKATEVLEEAARKTAQANGEEVSNKDSLTTWVHQIFKGTLTNETRCLSCENVTRTEEMFLDLSVDIDQNTSINACLRNFSSTEKLAHSNKFFCDVCCSLQEAERRMRIKHPPPVLALHLKRFKYMEQLQRYKKLCYRVVFPLELKLCNLTEDAESQDWKYELFAVVIHVGSGPNQGHYISIVKSHNQWLLFDDETVELIEERNIQSCFGSPHDMAHSTDAGYILFYQSTEATAATSQNPQQVNEQYNQNNS